MSEVTLQV